MSESNEASPGTMPPPPPTTGFQSASSLLKSQNQPPQVNSPSSKHVASGSSLRNASGGQPPIPSLPGPSSIANNGSNPTTNTNVSGQTGPSTRPINRPAASKNSIIYNSVQRRNPVLGSIKNVGVEIGDIVADYQVGAHNGVLFLSLKYHRLHPEYIHQRIEKMKGSYNLRIILVLCDVNEHQQSLREINKIAIINEYTIFIAWSNEEIGQYLTCFKSFENKSSDSLKEKVHQVYQDQLQHVLTSGRKINKTDSDNLASQFGSFKNISKQPSKVLSNVKGLGAAKVTSLVDAFNKPFLVGGLRKEGKSKGTIDIGQKESRAFIAVDSDTRKKNGRNGRDSHNDEEIEIVDDTGSPDWPDEDEEEQEQEAIPPTRGRIQSPSRSPGLSPEPRISDQGVWQDPLDDEDDDDEPTNKRPRVG
ncbi:uncharacterized protein L201_005960 [Kwoniella dendrophila CBS 6074]|uniref:ERCC1-like central domain-containing protein n=1 Tax=Kwoniella dendrophila CBS 6074 TaxID=1295534 RepID=A0AAX4K2G8_9TREE